MTKTIKVNDPNNCDMVRRSITNFMTFLFSALTYKRQPMPKKTLNNNVEKMDETS